MEIWPAAQSANSIKTIILYLGQTALPDPAAPSATSLVSGYGLPARDHDHAGSEAGRGLKQVVKMADGATALCQRILPGCLATSPTLPPLGSSRSATDRSLRSRFFSVHMPYNTLLHPA